ncbi:MAG: polysaccharide biosynthesis protein [Bacillota bacterium]
MAVVKQHFLHGAIILTIAGLISKVLGPLYRIPLARLIGAEGIGLYQMAYPIYTAMLALSTAGVPVAISILVAEHQAKGNAEQAFRVFRIAFFMLVVTGLLFSLLLFFGAYPISILLNEPRAFYPLVALSPAIFFAAVMSAFRGYFQGQQIMTPTGVSQVVEQLVRVPTVLIAALLLLPSGVEFGAAGGTFGAVAGSAAGLLFLILLFLRERWKNRGERRKKPAKPYEAPSTLAVIWRIVVIALPLSLGGLVMPLLQAIDVTLVPLRLQAAGISQLRATELFGQLTGMAGTLINLPAIITVSLSVSLVPAVAEVKARKDTDGLWQRLDQALRMTVMLVLPAAVGLFILAEPIGILLFDLAEVGIPLKALAPGVLFVGLYQVTSGALQGMGWTYLPVRHLLVGAVVKAGFTYQLTSIPSLGIKGAAAATVLAFCVAFLLNYSSLQHRIGYRFPWRDGLFKPGGAVAIMALVVKYTHGWVGLSLGQAVGALAGVAVGMLVYPVSLLLFGALRREDLLLLPGVGQFGRGLIIRLRWIK